MQSDVTAARELGLVSSGSAPDPMREILVATHRPGAGADRGRSLRACPSRLPAVDRELAVDPDALPDGGGVRRPRLPEPASTRRTCARRCATTLRIRSVPRAALHRRGRDALAARLAGRAAAPLPRSYSRALDRRPIELALRELQQVEARSGSRPARRSIGAEVDDAPERAQRARGDQPRRRPAASALRRRPGWPRQGPTRAPPSQCSNRVAERALNLLADAAGGNDDQARRGRTPAWCREGRAEGSGLRRRAATVPAAGRRAARRGRAPGPTKVSGMPSAASPGRAARPAGDRAAVRRAHAGPAESAR